MEKKRKTALEMEKEEDAREEESAEDAKEVVLELSIEGVWGNTASLLAPVIGMINSRFTDQLS